MEYLHHCVAPQCNAIHAGGGVLTCAKLRGVEPMNHNLLCITQKSYLYASENYLAQNDTSAL